MLTSDLVTSITRRAAVPVSQITFSQTDFYNLIDEETMSKMVPLILKNIEEYYTYNQPYNITMNQSIYPIPTRAIAGKLRDVQVISSTDPESITPLERLEVDNLFSSTSSSYRVLIKKSGFYIQGNNIVMYPTPNYTQNIINLEYYIRPGTCVDPSVCAQVQSINSSLNQVTVVTAPTNITTSTLVDMVNATSGFDYRAINQPITNIAGSVYTFSSLPMDQLGNITLQVGDYICQATQTCVVQVPQELLPLLSQYVVVRIMAAQGDNQNYQFAVQELSKLEENAQLLIAPRVDGKLKRVVNTRSVTRWV